VSRRRDVTAADNLRNNFAAKMSAFRSVGDYVPRPDGLAGGGCGRSGKSAAAEEEGGCENGHKSSPSISTDAWTVERDDAKFVTSNGTSWFEILQSVMCVSCRLQDCPRDINAYHEPTSM